MAIKLSQIRSRLPLHGKRPLFLSFRSSTGFITATVCTAIFTDIFLYAVVVPVFPFSLVDRLGVAEDDVQHWLSVLLAVYAAALLVGAPFFGYLADRVKYRRGPLLIGLVVVLGATVMLCFAKTLAVMIVGRIVQGLAASVIWVIGLALLADTVRGDGLAVAMGYVATAYSLGALVAPLLGGLVYNKSGYYAVFAMTFGVITFDIILRLTMIEKKAAEKWLHVDRVDEEESSPNDSTNARESEIDDDNDLPITASGTGHAPQRTIEKTALHQDDPTPKKNKVPPILSLWTSRRMLAAFFGNLVLAAVITGFETTLTLFVHRTFGWNSLAAGLLFLAPLTPIFFSPVIGQFVDRYGSRWIGAAGFVFTVPFLVLLRLVDHNSIHQKVLLAALLALIGVGLAGAMTALTAEFGKICDAKEQANPGVFGKSGAYAQSFSIFNISWAAGSLIGAFWSGGIYTAAGWDTITWTWALLCGVSALPVLLFTDGWIGKSCVGEIWRRHHSDRRSR